MRGPAPSTDNRGVIRASDAYRKITGATDWPLVAGVVLGLLAMGEVVVRVSPYDDPSIALILALCATFPLALVRTYLLVATGTITAATMVILVGGRPTTVAGVVAQLAVVYLIGRHRSRRAHVLAVLPFAVYAVAGDDGWLGLALLALTVMAVTIGGALRARREAVERDASRRAIADTMLDYAARAERARIVRELHDVVAHHISLIAVQAETARLTTPGMPDAGEKRLRQIGDTARAALTEMRRLLGVLREDAGAEETRRPQPGLEQLIELIDSARDSAPGGARLIVRGRVAALDPGIELTAFRIVQEALTNARRHAPGAAVDVELDYADEALRVRIRDSGPGPGDAPAVGGHGLLGMRERAAMVGGALSAGPAPSGGFFVEATLPRTQ
jgi:signal transduction histidine kinase